MVCLTVASPAVLRNIVKEDMNLTRLHGTIKNSAKRILLHMEKGSFSQKKRLLDNFCLDSSMENLREYLDATNHHEKMLRENETFWKGLIKEWLLEKVTVMVLGKPRIELSNKIAATRKKRLEERKTLLGKEGLLAKALELEEAKRWNDRKTPKKVWRTFPITSASTVKLMEIQSFPNGKFGPSKNESNRRTDNSFETDRFPFAFQFRRVPRSGRPCLEIILLINSN
jgi:Zn-dependent M16 (insulinase) family peptidase